ncbi:DNA polymerase domain-containing protein [Bacillus sp. T33-2]|uniref:DNA polymerase domain-containing protein n=1 Tax=Bacillus sp. T33-2 TaxID=2054168 RepID=UPI000C7605C1|nr:DNA polymerase domain-containing protein [Bacillus sp. T33-2]PLR98732.1 DNA polymerase domain-containing protein [Bacillus sp. T33-2]
MFELTIEGKQIQVSHPGQFIFQDIGITKMDYINYLLEVAPLLIPHAKDRLLMMWIYPHGITRRKIEKRSLPASAPEWVCHAFYKGKQRVMVNDISTLVWAANYGAVEFHVPFDRYCRENYPLELAFDLDPPDDASFGLVLEVALQLKQTLDSLGLISVPRTSGATGLQIFVPIDPQYSFEETRKINTFIAHYFLEKNPGKITLERVVQKRGKKLYFDYLQLWKGRTLPVSYSVRAKPNGTVATPLSWEEVQNGLHPDDFTIFDLKERIREEGDLFSSITTDKVQQQLGEIVNFIKKHNW